MKKLFHVQVPCVPPYSSKITMIIKKKLNDSTNIKKTHKNHIIKKNFLSGLQISDHSFKQKKNIFSIKTLLQKRIQVIFFKNFSLFFFRNLTLLKKIHLKMVCVKDVNQSDFVVAFAAFLKKSGKMTVPKWSDYAKTACHKQLAPANDDWFYTRGVKNAG